MVFVTLVISIGVWFSNFLSMFFLEWKIDAEENELQYQ